MLPLLLITLSVFIILTNSLDYPSIPAPGQSYPLVTIPHICFNVNYYY